MQKKHSAKDGLTRKRSGKQDEAERRLGKVIDKLRAWHRVYGDDDVPVEFINTDGSVSIAEVVRELLRKVITSSPADTEALKNLVHSCGVWMDSFPIMEAACRVEGGNE